MWTVNLAIYYYHENAVEEKRNDNCDKILVEIMDFCVRLDTEVMMSREKRMEGNRTCQTLAISNKQTESSVRVRQ